MYLSRPFCLVCPDFKKRRYKDYDYYENKRTGDLATKFTTPTGAEVTCNFNIETGEGVKRVKRKNYMVDCHFKNFKPVDASITSDYGFIFKNYKTGLISILPFDIGIEYGISKDGQVLELNDNKMYKFWKKFGFYKKPTMKKVKAMIEKIISGRRAL